MKIRGTILRHSKTPINVWDSNVGSGYLQGLSGSLPDVDIDYQSDRRADVKQYCEQRYNRFDKNGNTTCNRVFSVGTVTTLKAKAVIKDVARTMRLPVSTVNYITAMIDDDKSNWSDLFVMAKTNKRLADFIERYPKLFEDIRSLMFSPRSSSIHASALVVTPIEVDGEVKECYDITPIKKVDGMLVSEFSGTEIDATGLLKNDCLATKELSKMHEKCDLINSFYGTDYNFDKLMLMEPNDPDVFELFSEGATQGVFQFASKGITGIAKDLRPSCIEDLVALNALWRPATIASGSVDDFVNRHNGLVEPTYLWGTEEVLKSTFGVLIYQEQISLIAQKVGGFSKSDSIHLIKAVSKKKKDKIKAYKSQFMEGALSQGCPEDAANTIWTVFENAGLYCFNKSHSASYALTAYWGAWLKCKYPTATYTIEMKWADDKELPALMGEMSQFSKARLVQPDINRSGLDFTPDFETDEILWSLTRIKQCTTRSMQWVIDERTKNGPFTDIENFIERIFRYKLKVYKYWDDPDNESEAVRCPVNARHVRNLILAGCFDDIEPTWDITYRMEILRKAADKLGFQLNEEEFPEDLIDKHYFWSQLQQQVSGFGQIDYRRIFDSSELKSAVKGRATYRTLEEIQDSRFDGRKVAICCNIVEVQEKKYKSSQSNQMETFAKLSLQQGTSLNECIIWAEEYATWKEVVQTAKNKIAVFTAMVKYSDFRQRYELVFSKGSQIEIM